MDLLFLNVSNPADSKNRRNKRIVKKWASVNNQRQNGASPSPQPETNEDHPIGSNEPSSKPACWMGTLSYADGNGVVDRKMVSSSKDFARSKRQNPKRDQISRVTSSKRSLKDKDVSVDSDELDQGAPTANHRDSTPSPKPSDVLGAVNRDPFDTLPLASNKRYDYLLHMYAQGESPSKSCIHEANRCNAPKVHTELRKQVWIPLALQSKASHSALLAYTETSPGIIDSDSAVSHLHIALKGVIEDLNDPMKESNDVTCFTVILLMIIAQRMNDTQAIRAHARGLTHLAHQRGRRLNYIVESFLNNYASWDNLQTAFDSTSPRHIPISDSHCISPDILNTPAEDGAPISAFIEMLRMGLLDISTAMFYRHAVLLATLGACPDAGSDWVTINGIVSHMFLWEYLPRHDFSSFDTVCIFTMRLCLDAIFPTHNLSDSTTQSIIVSILRGLVKSDLDPIWINCPQALLWIALTIGPLAQGRAREWFRGLLKQVHQATSIWTAEEAVAVLTGRFVIAPSLISGAELFWMEMMFDDRDDREPTALVLDFNSTDENIDTNPDVPQRPYFHPRNRPCLWRKHLEGFKQYREKRVASYLDE